MNIWQSGQTRGIPMTTPRDVHALCLRGEKVIDGPTPRHRWAALCGLYLGDRLREEDLDKLLPNKAEGLKEIMVVIQLVGHPNCHPRHGQKMLEMTGRHTMVLDALIERWPQHFSITVDDVMRIKDEGVKTRLLQRGHIALPEDPDLTPDLLVKVVRGMPADVFYRLHDRFDADVVHQAARVSKRRSVRVCVSFDITDGRSTDAADGGGTLAGQEGRFPRSGAP